VILGKFCDFGYNIGLYALASYIFSSMKLWNDIFSLKANGFDGVEDILKFDYPLYFIVHVHLI
jgi:ABC-type microcin C transport system permease subunit YejB